MERSWYVIINNFSGWGSGKRAWHKVQQILDDTQVNYRAVFTEYSGHGIELSRKAVEDGFRDLMVVGGDGTANEVINGICTQAACDSSEVSLGMISTGTGNDWIRTTGLPSTPEKAVQKVLEGNTRLHDVGKAVFNLEGEEKTRYFLNIAGLGYDGFVTERVSHASGFLMGSKLSYWLAILTALFSYKHTDIVLEIDGVSFPQKTLSVAIGNCSYNGGGMKQLPDAKFDDGLLDITVINEMSKLQMVLNLPRLLSGSFIKMKEVSTYRAKKVNLRSNPEIWLEVDGEVLGKSPVRIEALPSAVKIFY